MFRGLGLVFRGLGFRGLGFRGLGFRGLGFRGLGFSGLGFRGAQNRAFKQTGLPIQGLLEFQNKAYTYICRCTDLCVYM